MAEVLNCKNEECPSKDECHTFKYKAFQGMEEYVVYKFDEWTGKCGHFAPLKEEDEQATGSNS